jgi:prevent-host-death family protein|uniref:type II toxin-antitoxin system Phd/YefM family antitoxin n=1 Tax=Aquiluna sp. TaxID=2053504 RepID=UPI0040470B44
MTYVFNMHEAKTKLSKLVELAESGEDVQIARNGKPAVKLVVSEKRTKPKFGEFEPLEGWISDDFDEPLPEWREYMISEADSVVEKKL